MADQLTLADFAFRAHIEKLGRDREMLRKAILLLPRGSARRLALEARQKALTNHQLGLEADRRRGRFA